MDVLSDKKKAEIALLEEQARINALKDHHNEQLKENGEYEEPASDDDFL
jgi:hypothetical protein